ncbi:S41 family peptidase [Nostoc sp. NIES-2111]
MFSMTRYVCLLVGLALVNDAAQQTELWVQCFQQAWTTIRDRHFDKTLGGLDWEEAGKATRAAVAAASSEAEARKAIEAMLEKLGHSHVGLIPREVFAAEGKGNGWLGLETRKIEGKRVVWRVAPGSPAAEAGVKPGWILDGPWPARGEVGQEAELSFDPGGKLRLRFAQAKGQMAAFGNLPPIPIDIEFRKIGAVGYFRLSAFFEPDWLQAQMAEAVAACRDCPGFVVDLRGNPGGIGALSAALAGWFLEEAAVLGTVKFRDYEMKLMANPRVEGFRGKLAVLVDGQSMSTSEFFAGAIQDWGRGRIFGERTAGMALPSAVEKLPNGDALQYTTASYVSASGKALEGRGVSPDVEVPLRQADLLAGRDAALAAALEWIRK